MEKSIIITKTHEAKGRHSARYSWEYDGAVGTGYASEASAEKAAQAYVIKSRKEAAKKHYWAVYCGGRVDFEGSFSACWEWFVERYHDKTLGQLSAAKIRVARKA